MRLTALLFSISVHLVAGVALWRGPAVRPVTPPPPVEIELTFKRPEARRAPPQPAPAPTVTPPRRAKGASGAPKSAHAGAPLPLTIAPLDATGDVALLPPGGGGHDAGVGDDREDEVSAPRLPLIHRDAVLISLPPVTYPERARLDELEGVVVLWVTLGTDGHVTSVEVRASADASLSEAAREAMLRARFRPALEGTQPVSSQFEYRYRFKLE